MSVKRPFLLAILLILILPQAVFAETAHPADCFLTRLCMVNADDLNALETPSEDYACYLQERLGEFCAQEVLDDLLAMRYPFSLMEDGVCLGVVSVEIEALDPETAGEGRSSFTVETIAARPDGSAEAMTFTGRFRQDATGQIIDLQLNLPWQ